MFRKVDIFNKTKMMWCEWGGGWAGGGWGGGVGLIVPDEAAPT